MKCFEWRHINCNIRYEIDAYWYAVERQLNGNVTVHGMRPTYRPLMQCNIIPGPYDPTRTEYIQQRSMMRRQSNDCNRFQLDFWPEYNFLNNLDSTTLEEGGYDIYVLTDYLKYAPDNSGTVSAPYSKPWNPSDPFYPRALELWQARSIGVKQFNVYLMINFLGGQVLATATMPEVADGAIGQWDSGDPAYPITGTVTMHMEFLP